MCRSCAKMSSSEIKSATAALTHWAAVGFAQGLKAFLLVTPPASAVLVVVRLLAWLSGSSRSLLVSSRSRLLTLLYCSAFAETAFAVACARDKARAQALFDAEEHSPTTSALRERAFHGCLADIVRSGEHAGLSAAEAVESFLRRWLGDPTGGEASQPPEQGLFAPASALREGNVEAWLAWAFFAGRAVAELEPCEAAQLAGFMRALRQLLPSPVLAPGHDGAVQALRFTTEPVPSRPRPLSYYLVTDWLCQRAYAPLRLRLLGFGGSRMERRTFNYFVREARCEGAPRLAPLVLVHGIGIGVPLYVSLVRDLVAVCGAERDLVVLELPAVSQQMFPKELLPAPFVEDVRTVLAAVEQRRLARGGELFASQPAHAGAGPGAAAWVGHSYGTFAMAWVVKRAPELVHALAFLDPGPFLLHNAKTLQAIVYHKATNEFEELFHYFMRSEFFFNAHLRRHFLWQDNLLYLADIPARCSTLIVLSEHDAIMPAQEVEQLYNAEGHKHPHVGLVVLKESFHGAMLLTSAGRGVAERVHKLR